MAGTHGLILLRMATVGCRQVWPPSWFTMCRDERMNCGTNLRRSRSARSCMSFVVVPLFYFFIPSTPCPGIPYNQRSSGQCHDRSIDQRYVGQGRFRTSNRQRFTIAHELGHFFFHSGMEEHVDKDFRVNWRRTAESPTAIDWEEVTANRFAAEFLMPTRFMKSDLDAIRTIDKRVVTILAVRYKVSPEAMKIRLSNLGIVGPF